MHLQKDKIQNLCREKIRREWLDASSAFPAFLEPVPENRKRENEALLEEFLREASPLMKASPSSEEEKKQLTDRVNILAADFLEREQILKVNKLGTERIEACKKAMEDFLHEVSMFDRSLPKTSAAQAFRNYTVYLVFMMLHGLKPGCSPAILGYSLLYPYTDNFLDSGQSTAKKQAFNNLIRDILEGRPVKPAGRLQKQTARLLQMIYSVYDREAFPEVTQSLLLIYEAQLQSMAQRRPAGRLKDTAAPPLSAGEVLDTSIFKGGASVLADRCLVPKRITWPEVPFYLGFGFFLQLVDDLQDIEEDRAQGSLTLFTCSGIEETVNKAFHFVHGLFRETFSFTEQAAGCPETDGGAGTDRITASFLCENCRFLLLSCILMQEKHFSENYLNQAEPFLPVSLSFSRRISGQYGDLLKM